MRAASKQVNSAPKGCGKTLTLAMMCALICFGCQERGVDYPPRLMPEGLSKSTADLKTGHDLFQSKCATCHGKPSEGRSDRADFFAPPAPDFTTPDYLQIDPAYLYWRIETGKNVDPYRSQGSVMPAWGAHLSETQIWQIVAFLQARAG